MITISINVGKIDKGRFTTGKNGERYMELVLIETPNSKYNTDYLCTQGRTKEEREKGVKSDIIGNAKIVETKGNRGNGKPATKEGGDDGDDW
jgi:hypothetical protein